MIHRILAGLALALVSGAFYLAVTVGLGFRPFPEAVSGAVIAAGYFGLGWFMARPVRAGGLRRWQRLAEDAGGYEALAADAAGTTADDADAWRELAAVQRSRARWWARWLPWWPA